VRRFIEKNIQLFECAIISSFDTVCFGKYRLLMTSMFLLMMSKIAAIENGAKVIDEYYRFSGVRQ
jgi:hypothetical protein